MKGRVVIEMLGQAAIDAQLQILPQGFIEQVVEIIGQDGQERQPDIGDEDQRQNGIEIYRPGKVIQQQRQCQTDGERQRQQSVPAIGPPLHLHDR